MLIYCAENKTKQAFFFFFCGSLEIEDFSSSDR